MLSIWFSLIVVFCVTQASISTYFTIAYFLGIPTVHMDEVNILFFYDVWMTRMKKKAFTLIEMLIVIVIIGILAAALIPRLVSVQGRARDTKRKADLQQIGTALAIYKLDNA